MQQEVKEGKLTVKKMGTNNNPADLLIKAMNGEKMMKYMGFDIDNCRASDALTDNKLACSVTNQAGRPQRRALRPREGCETLTRP